MVRDEVYKGQILKRKLEHKYDTTRPIFDYLSFIYLFNYFYNLIVKTERERERERRFELRKS